MISYLIGFVESHPDLSLLIFAVAVIGFGINRIMGGSTRWK